MYTCRTCGHLYHIGLYCSRTACLEEKGRLARRKRHNAVRFALRHSEWKRRQRMTEDNSAGT